ncbi:hypothetical protein ACP4OV_016473 [Aristida adscensionis]
MFRGGAKAGIMSTSNELPVERAVTVRKVERIEVYNAVTKPPASAPATAKMGRSVTVSVVRVADVDENAEGVVSVPISYD